MNTSATAMTTTLLTLCFALASGVSSADHLDRHIGAPAPAPVDRPIGLVPDDYDLITAPRFDVGALRQAPSATPYIPPCADAFCDPAPAGTRQAASEPAGADEPFPGDARGEYPGRPTRERGAYPGADEPIPWDGDAIYDPPTKAVTAMRFAVTVTVEEGFSPFEDCMALHSDGRLTLDASGGMSLSWVSAVPHGRGFSAVSDADASTLQPFALAIYGSRGEHGIISGHMVNEYGLTFAFNGNEDPSCVVIDRKHELGGAYANAPVGTKPYEPNEQSLAARLFETAIFGDQVEVTCLYFGIAGDLQGYGATTLIWRMSVLNKQENTFQAVAPMSGPGAGLALHGFLTDLGQLRVQGVVSDSAGLRPLAGSGRETFNCIQL